MKKAMFMLGALMGAGTTYMLTDKKMQKKATKMIDDLMNGAEELFDKSDMM